MRRPPTDVAFEMAMRPAQAVIDLNALRHNYQLAKTLSNARALAVIKADAYGHGAVRCAQALTEADGFAVACIEEALELREAGIRQPILLLEGFFEQSELALIQAHDLWCVIHTEWQLKALEQAALGSPIKVWLKLDSGMHRVGFDAKAFQEAYKRLKNIAWVEDVVLMSHMARADEPECPRTREQLASFNQATEGLTGQVSLRNSPSILQWPELNGDWVRPGLMLYGASPFNQFQEQALNLQEVMTLTSKVIAVRDLAFGEPLGYGGRFVADQPTRVGVVAMGYADGYPRHAPTGTPVAVDGQLTRLIGRISMDMLTVDLTDLPQAGVGSHVELWGKQVKASRVAEGADTIAYQLFCNLKRVPRRYEG